MSGVAIPRNEYGEREDVGILGRLSRMEDKLNQLVMSNFCSYCAKPVTKPYNMHVVCKDAPETASID
jgi:hypothetical protein